MNAHRNGWKLIAEKSIGGKVCGRNIYVKDEIFPFYENLKKTYLANYHLMSMFRSLMLLNAQPHQTPINHTQTFQSIDGRGYRLKYSLAHGDVLIEELIIDSSIEPEDICPTTGLYQTKLNNENLWKTSDKPSPAMKTTHKWGDAHYASVAGSFNNKNEAGSKLISHITKAYGGKEVLSRDIQKKGQHYSLYWISKKKHKEEETIKGLTSLIQQAADKKAPVNWLIHGEGAGTLVRSLEILQTTPSLSRYAAQDEMIVRNIQLNMGMQKVFISNPRGASVDKIKQLCKKVGIEYVNANINPRDMYSAESWRNTAKELKSFSQKNAFKYTTAGAVGVGMTQSGFGTLEKSLQFIASHLDNPMMVSVGVGVTIIAANNAKNKVSSAYQAVNAMVKSSFGDANQRWYDSDKDLVA